MKTLLVLVTLLVAVSSPAFARQWYNLNAGEARCEPIEAIEVGSDYETLHSPNDYIQMMHDMEFVTTTSVYHYADGGIRVLVEQKIHGTDASMIFFTAMKDCNLLLQKALEKGVIIAPNELK